MSAWVCVLSVQKNVLMLSMLAVGGAVRWVQCLAPQGIGEVD